MKQLPPHPNLEHLKEQAKDLLRAYRAGVQEAKARLDAAGCGPEPRLHDAQFCIAREYGFASWPQLSLGVEVHRAFDSRPDDARQYWLRLAYGATPIREKPAMAARLAALRPQLAMDDPYCACAVGEISPALLAAPNQSGGPRRMPPLIAVTHSTLVRLPPFRERLVAAAKRLLEAGADPNVPYVDVHAPEHPLSALYGAAGFNRVPELTRMLLDAGANPNDGESLYHSIDGRGHAITRMLLDAGGVIDGTNALARQLDFDDIEGLRLLLDRGANPNLASANLVSPLYHAIRRGRSRAHLDLLIAAGADTSLPGLRLHAIRHGVADAAVLFPGDDPAGPEALFTGACARADRAAAEAVLRERPDLMAGLGEAGLAMLPQMVESGNEPAARLMVELGWPIAAQGGDWGATALNIAVFQGNVPLTRFLLAHGASWEERHGYHDNLVGTLSFASVAEPVENGDWLGCARALVESGMPAPPFPSDYEFSPELMIYFDELRKGETGGHGQ